VKIAEGKPVGNGTRVVISTRSLWSDNERLTGHLKNADFFNVEKHPTATFQSSAIEQQSTNWNITGELTMHGVTKQITFPAQIQVSADKVEVDAEFAINRFDFEMKYPGKADDLIRQEVVLKLDITAAPGQANFGELEKAAPIAPAATAGQ
jgi:polyisoprenoid-binding protein YceI